MYRASIVFIATCLVLSVTAPVAAQSPEPPPYPDGAGVTFEPAGPSVWRAVEPEWDCDAAYPRRPFHDGAEVAPDGSIWFLDHQRGIRELGSCPIVEPKLTFGTRDQALGPDGTLWVLNDDRLWSWDGTDWLVHLEGFNQPGRVGDIDGGGYSYSTECEAGPCYFFVDVAPDGRVWLSGTTLSAYDGAEWTNYMDDPLVKIVVGFGPEGSAWVQGGEGGGDIFVIQPSGEPPASGPAGEAAASPPATTAESAIAESFPASIGGRPVEVTTWSGPEWLARYDFEALGAGAVTGIEATEAPVAAAGTTLDELTIATVIIKPSPGNIATIAAVHIPGSRAFDLVDPVVDLMAGAIEPSVGWESMSDRWVALVIDKAIPGSYPVKVYPAGDTVWVIQADRAVAESIVAALPPQPTLVGPVEPLTQRIEVPELGIAVSLPQGWAVETLPEAPERTALADRLIKRRGLDARRIPVLDARGPDTAHHSAPDQCSLGLFGPTQMLPDEFAERVQIGTCAIIDAPDDGLTRSYVHPGGCSGPSAGFSESFALGSGDHVAYLWCWSMDPLGGLPRDIAETIELLPAEE